jgi:glucose/arabinose dehydrogenase
MARRRRLLNGRTGVSSTASRKLDPSDISLPEGYKIEVFAEGLTTPINATFSDAGDLYVADAGVATGSGKVLKYNGRSFDVIAEGFNPPLTGITCYNGSIYVAHRGFVTMVTPDGKKTNILEGLPSLGDHHNNRVVFGSDGKMYFGQGTATNSGVVGVDNASWVQKYPFFHDYPGAAIQLVGQNFTTDNFLSAAPGDTAYTGAYSPFGVPAFAGEVVKGITKASGSILRANPDGSELQLVAWGLRNPFRIRFDRYNRLFVANHGMDVRGSRPVANSPDDFVQVMAGAWYGWPDYTGGAPVTLPQFKPVNGEQPTFLLVQHPMTPPMPLVSFAPHSAIMGFDFNTNPNFGPLDDVFIAEYGSEAPETTGGLPLPGVGHRVSCIDMRTGSLQTFAINKTGYAASYTHGGGLERPIDAVFGPDGALYVVDFNQNLSGEADEFVPGTGVIWRITHV